MPAPENFNASDNTNTAPIENVGVTQSSVWNQNSMDTWRAAASAGRSETASSLPADFSIDFGTSNDSSSNENPSSGDISARTSQDRGEKPSENPSDGPMKRPLRDAPPRLDVPSCTAPGPRNDGSQGLDRITNALSDVSQYRSCLHQREEGIREYHRQRAEDDRQWSNGEGRYAR